MQKSNSYKKRQGYKAWKKGLGYERICKWYLRLKGYRLLFTRYRTPVGEWDLICLKKRQIIFLEVKFRTDSDSLYDALSFFQQKRLYRAALFFLMREKNYQEYAYRFDCIFIYKPFILRHMKNIILPQ